MGADVVKVESVGLGDDTRYMPPLRTAGHTSAGAVFLSVNRNKRRSGILAALYQRERSGLGCTETPAAPAW